MFQLVQIFDKEAKTFKFIEPNVGFISKEYTFTGALAFKKDCFDLFVDGYDRLDS